MRAFALLQLPLAALAAAGCAWFESDTTFAIPDAYVLGDDTYTLLYSTIGYDLAGTKRVLIRGNDPDGPVSVGLAFQWRLVAEDGRVVQVGNAPYDGDAWGIPVWVADFSDLNDPGTYRLTLEAPDHTLATDDFPVEDHIFFRRTFVPVALQNAEMRAAPPSDDSGFYEDTSMEGTAAAHGEYLIGLLSVYNARQTSMADEMRQRTRNAIARCFEYLMLLSDPATGEFAHTSPRRPYQGGGAEDTVAGARALARYAAEYQGVETITAERAYRRARQSDAWLLAEAPDAYSEIDRAAVAYDFYRYSSDEAQLDRAAASVRSIAETYDLREMERSSYDTRSHLETMFRMWRDIPAYPDRPVWEEAARHIAAEYADFIERNPFDVIAPGTAEGGMSPQAQWDEMESAPPPGEGPDGIIGNEWFLARAADAVFLARMTDDESLARAAAGSLFWITGLNPGVSGDRVAAQDIDKAASSPFLAASFLVGVGGRPVQTYPRWEYQRALDGGSIAGGFRSGFSFDDSMAAGAPSIVRDGLWLSAITWYEDLVQRGVRAGVPNTPHSEADGGDSMRVAAVTATERAGDMIVSVEVVGPDGERLPEVLVTVAWRTTASEGLPVESTIRVDTCETFTDGECFVTLAPDALDGERPIIAAVTNLEHALYRVIPSPEAFGEPVTFD